MNRKPAPGAPKPAPLKATPYPAKSTAPATPRKMEPLHPEATHTAAPEMRRGFVRDGAIHLLGGKTLPNGVFVKVVRE